MSEVPQPAGLGNLWRLWWDFELSRPTGGGPIARISQVVRSRAVLSRLISRGLKVKYSQSLLGYAWSLVEPLLLIFVYWLVFGHVARLNLPAYPLFIATAMMPWIFFNGALTQSTGALTSNAGIIRTISLPRELYPIAVVGEQVIEYLLSLPVVFVVGALYGIFPSHYIVYLPLATAIETVLVTGLALMLSAMNTLLRDISRILRVILRVLFYLSPVVYPASAIHGFGATVYRLNPLVGILELNRAIWYPHYGINPGLLQRHTIIAATGAALFFVVGWSIFIALERPVLKEL